MDITNKIHDDCYERKEIKTCFGMAPCRGCCADCAAARVAHGGGDVRRYGCGGIYRPFCVGPRDGALLFLLNILGVYF